MLYDIVPLFSFQNPWLGNCYREWETKMTMQLFQGIQQCINHSHLSYLQIWHKYLYSIISVSSMAGNEMYVYRSLHLWSMHFSIDNSSNFTQDFIVDDFPGSHFANQEVMVMFPLLKFVRTPKNTFTSNTEHIHSNQYVLCLYVRIQILWHQRYHFFLLLMTTVATYKQQIYPLPETNCSRYFSFFRPSCHNSVARAEDP